MISFCNRGPFGWLVGFEKVFESTQRLEKVFIKHNTVDSRYLDFGYLEYSLISKRKSDHCFNIEI